MSKTHRLPVLLGVLFLIASASPLAAQPAMQVTVSGTVVDAETGDALAGASVFLANSLLGGATDQNGFFSIPGLSLGSHDLVASFVGYEAQTLRLRLTQAEDVTVDFQLEALVVKSEEIEVTAASPKTWNRQFKRFEKFFFGVSRNASKTKILNPEVLEFNDDDVSGAFTARADAPLLIENNALGYRLHFVLDEFYLQESKRLIRYRGRVGFTEIAPHDEREQRRWEKRREEAYNGSFRHFLASLVRDRLTEEGFMLVSEDEDQTAAYSGVPGARPSARITTVQPEEILGPGELPFERKLDFTGYLKLLYFNEIPSGQYLKFRAFANRGLQASEDEQVSWISLNHPGVVFTTDGLIEDTYAITKFGYWYFERVAEMLPTEYRPPGMAPVTVIASAPLDAAVRLRPAYTKGLEAIEAGDYNEASAFLASVVEADARFDPDGLGSAAYWLGMAYAAQEQLFLAHGAWLEGLEAQRADDAFEVRLADAFVRSVFRHQRQDDYEQATLTYLELLEQADTGLSEEDHEIVLRHIAQMLSALTDEEYDQVVVRDPGPMLQRLELKPGSGAYLATLWRSLDPLPASLLNERAAEHLARVMYAEKNYAFDNGRAGFDDRGEAFVRYGPPHTSVSIPIDLARATQVIRENAYPLPGPMISPLNEFWTYIHVDERVYYLFVEQGGRYQDASPEDLVPRELRSAHRRVGKGHLDPRTLENTEGVQAPANQVMAEALFEVWKSIYTQLALYHPVFEAQAEELDFQESDLRATRAGSGNLSASALSFVNGVDLKFNALSREATRAREEDAPRAHSRIGDELEQFPVAARAARFLAADGTTRTEFFWSHVPGSLTLSKKQQTRLLGDGQALPERYLIQMVLNQHSVDYGQRTPTQTSYLAAELARGSTAPVQILDLPGTTEPYHLSVQWDQFFARFDRATGTVDQSTYLRTGVQRLDGFAPLSSDPQVLEMSDLKPVNLDAAVAAQVDDPVAEEDALTPYPFASLTPETPLGLYFEIYHLTFGGDDQTHYTIEYEVVRDPDTRRITQSSAQTPYTGASRTAEEFIALDLSDIGSARALEIIVRVVDDMTGRTVERAIAFSLP